MLTPSKAIAQRKREPARDGKHGLGGSWDARVPERAR
jgi:hypothetical protein